MCKKKFIVDRNKCDVLMLSRKPIGPVRRTGRESRKPPFTRVYEQRDISTVRNTTHWDLCSNRSNPVFNPVSIGTGRTYSPSFGQNYPLRRIVPTTYTLRLDDRVGSKDRNSYMFVSGESLSPPSTRTLLLWGAPDDLYGNYDLLLFGRG